MKRRCLRQFMQLPKRLSEQLEGKEGPTRQKAARLVVDLARCLLYTSPSPRDDR